MQVIVAIFIVASAINCVSGYKSSIGNFSSEYVFAQITDYIAKLDNSSDTFRNAASCNKHLQKVLTDLGTGQLWSYQFPDAWAKIPSGILLGHLVELGNYDQCLRINELLFDDTEAIKGQYCLASIPTGYVFAQPVVVPIKLGICIPASCDPHLVDAALKEFVQPGPNFTILDTEKCRQRDVVIFDAVDWVTIGLSLFIGVVVVASTAYEFYVRKYDKPVHQPILIAFSLMSNWSQLMRIDNRKSANTVSCLNGIRSISIVWIVFGHSYMMSLLLPNINSLDIVKWTQTPFSMLLQSGAVSVDSFFFLSGFLLAWTAYKEMDKSHGKLSVVYMYVHRYLRLTPVLAFGVLFFASLYRHIGDGPLWNSFSSSNTFCAESWWATLLYVENYAFPGRMCFGHAWYLACDFQLYVISPLLLIPLWKWGKRATAGLVVFAILSVVYVFSIILIKHLSIGNSLGADSPEMRSIYYSTHARLAPWVVGLITGWWMCKARFQRIRVSTVIVVLGWAASLTCFATVLFALYPSHLEGARKLSEVEDAFYMSLSRLAWPLALAWLVFACFNGYGGVINSFLSWSLWQPLARLSYCIYITHLLVETINAGSMKTNPHFSDYESILRFWGDFGITLIVSVVAYLTLENPIVGIEKAAFGKKKSEMVSKETLCESS